MIVTTIAGIIQHTPRPHNTRAGRERVLNLDVSVRQRVKNKQTGAWESDFLHIDVTIFGPRADSLGGFLKKGSQIGATGELRLRRYIGRDTTEKLAIELYASQVWPLDWTPRVEAEPPQAQHRDELAGDRTQGGESFRAQRPANTNQPSSAAAAALPDEDDDLPF